MRFNIKNQDTTSFKKRYTIGYKIPKIIFGDFSLTITKSYNLEYIYLYNIRRGLKKIFKKTKRGKIWLFLHKNYPLTKKSKNSRMGKGKGSLSRFCSRIKQNHNIFEFIGFSIKNVFFLKKLFLKKLKIPITIGCNFFLKKSYTHFGKNENFLFFRGYKNFKKGAKEIHTTLKYFCCF